MYLERSLHGQLGLGTSRIIQGNPNQQTRTIKRTGSDSDSDSLRRPPRFDPQSTDHDDPLHSFLLCSPGHILSTLFLDLFKLFRGAREDPDEGDYTVGTLEGRVEGGRFGYVE